VTSYTFACHLLW